MKRKKRIYLGAAMLIVTMTLSYMACQKPTEPNPTAIPVTWKVYVLDEVGNAIPNAAVQLTADSGNAIYSFPVTQQDGSATITPSVPAGYIQYAAAIAAPNYPAQSSQTVTLGCSDTVLVFTLIKPAVVQCGTATTVSDTLHTVCFGSSDSAQTLVTVPCPGTTTVSAAINTPPTTNPNLWSVTYAKVSNGVTSAAIANPSFTLAEGDKVLIKVLYKPTAISTGNDEFNETLTLTSNAAGSTPTPFTYAVIGSSENCTSCDCPPNSYTAQLGTAASPDSACVGVTQDTSFNLAKLKIENNGTCTWKFILQTPNNFGNGSVVSIGSGFNPSFTVSPGQTLDSISILFTPQQNQLYNATAIYQIELISASGTVTTCSQTLTLSFVGQGAAPNCSVDVGKSSILQTSGGYNLTACVGQSASGTLVIDNTGPCEAPFIGATIAGTAWSITPATSVTIPAHGSYTFQVSFNPTTALVYGANGNECGAQTDQFPATLTATTCSGVNTYNLNGLANACHQSLDVTSPDTAVSPQGFWVEDNNVIANALGDTNWTMFVTQVDPVGKTAVLTAWSPAPGLYRSFFKLETQILGGVSLCPPTGIACTNNYIDDCGKETQTQLTIQEGDVILFSYFQNGGTAGAQETDCGIFYVTNIGKPDQGGHAAVTFTFCYPLFTTQ